MATTEKDEYLHLLFQYQISGFLNCLLEYDKTYSNELTIVRRFLHILNVFLQNYHINFYIKDNTCFLYFFVYFLYNYQILFLF
jgi:hypothetical protein